MYAALAAKGYTGSYDRVTAFAHPQRGDWSGAGFTVGTWARVAFDDGRRGSARSGAHRRGDVGDGQRVILGPLLAGPLTGLTTR
jgi:hypothetical protein